MQIVYIIFHIHGQLYVHVGSHICTEMEITMKYFSKSFTLSNNGYGSDHNCRLVGLYHDLHHAEDVVLEKASKQRSTHGF